MYSSVTSEWIKSPTARRVLLHWADARPAWLWSASGETLLWRNASARFFHGKAKKHGIKLAPEAEPIKGQISRLIRLGSVGRSSLSRIQFLAGDRPISTTCAVTPLELEDGEIGLLIVGVDPIEPELLEAQRLNGITERLLPAGSDYLLIDDDGQIAGGTERALLRYAPHLESEGLPDLHDEGAAPAEIDGEMLTVTRFKASPRDAMLLLFESADAPQASIEEIREEEGMYREEPADEPLLPMGLPDAPTASVVEQAGEPVEEPWVEPFEPRPEIAGLSSLFDRLAEDDGLYTPLTEKDETFAGPLHENAVQPPLATEFQPPSLIALPEDELYPTTQETTEDLPEEQQVVDVGPETVAEGTVEAAPAAGEDLIAAVIAYADDEEDEPVAAAPTRVWKVTGRGFARLSDTAAPEGDLAEIDGTSPSELETAEPTLLMEPPAETSAPDSASVEQVSRYNFDELSRILTDRVGGEPQRPSEDDAAALRRRASDSALINPAGETFVLNRLPIGIMVFRDQQVLFANRALTDLTGHDSVESLRSAGLGAIFPGEDDATAGPVTHLVRRDGSRIAVRARLQSISWQGRPALMLSAMTGEEGRGHEGAVRAFAEIAADAREEGFVRADRSGVVTEVSLHARVILGKTESDLLGVPLSALLDGQDLPALQEFLERPARFAETERPSLATSCVVPGVQVLLFTEGQAGVVTGYFGFLRNQPSPVVQSTAAPAAPAVAERAEYVEPSMLARLSRGIRRPLNTIIGFSDLIRSSAFGTIENARYIEYARDIRTAGNEIAVLVDELDDFTRLKEGRYAARPAELDLAALLESCIVRVRGQAGLARVFVRSAISERLPKIRADRASLGQAVLNLLASAIDQTPAGASVILSAQVEDDGSISVNVRDSGTRSADLGERFVVFRDGVSKDGEALAPVRSTVGLALTRSLLAVNTCSLSVDPSGVIGTRFSMVIPADLVAKD